MVYWDGSAPKGCAFGQDFDVKIQTGAMLLLYDKTRNLLTTISSGNCKQMPQLVAAIEKFSEFAGRKAYFRARVTEHGKLVIFTKTPFAKKW